MTVVPMAQEHIAALAALESACFAVPWSAAALAEELENPCAAFQVAVDETGRVLGYVGSQTVLDESAVTAVKRPIAGGFGFGGDNSLPVEACALALWGAKTSRRDPTRKMKIG